MSLSGSLEDLPLLDILQIVSFSKKTGWIGIRTQAGEAAVVFRSGSIVAAPSWELPPLDPRFDSLQPSVRESLIRKRIEVAIDQLTWLRDGEFQFSLGELPPEALAGFDAARETLEVGVNPQELLLELARGMDEDRRDSWSAVEAPFGDAAALEERIPAGSTPEAAPAEEPAQDARLEQELLELPPLAEEQLPGPAVEDLFETPPAEPLAAAQPEARPRRDLAPEYTALRELVPEYTVPLQALPETLLAAAAAALPARAQPPLPAAPSEQPASPSPLAEGRAVGPDDAELRPEAALESAPAAPATADAARPAPPAAEAGHEAAPAGPLAAPEEIRALLLVDDEDDVRAILARSFTEGGYQVVEAEDPEAAMKKASLLSKSEIAFVAVVDLGMPTSGGASFLGGFEVVKRLAKMKLDPPVLMMTEKLTPAFRARAKQMRIESVVFKPGLSKLDPEQHRQDLRGFAERLLADVLPRLSRRSQPQRATADALRPQAEARAEDAARDLKVLQQHLAELRGSPDVTEISTLVMRVAREFFERGMLLLVRNEEARGLGGFGPTASGDTINRALRQLKIPLAEPSLLLDVVASGKPWSGALPEAAWSRMLDACVGRLRSTRVALLPLVAHRDTIALLVGDNPASGRALGRLEAIELFMREAGAALEAALLQRKLRAVREPG